MKKIILIALFLTLAIFSNSFAQKTNLNIGVIDVEEVLKNSLAMKQVKAKISKKEKLYQTQIDKKQQLLEKELQKIKSKQSVLSKEALKEEEIKFNKKFNDLKTELDTKQKSLKKAYVESIAQLDKKINMIVATISEEKNIDLILPASGVISYQEDLDISSQVLTKLNQQMKKIKINFD